LLTDNPNAQTPEEGLSYGFIQGGGDYLTDCRGKSEDEIARELITLLEETMQRTKS